MYELKKIGKVVMSKFVGTGPWSYNKRIYRAAVSQRLRNTALEERSPEPCCCENIKTLYVVSLQVYTLLTSSITTVQLVANFLPGSQH